MQCATPLGCSVSRVLKANGSTAAPHYLELLPDQHFELVKYCLAVHCTAGWHSAASWLRRVHLLHREVHRRHDTAISAQRGIPRGLHLKDCFTSGFRAQWRYYSLCQPITEERVSASAVPAGYSAAAAGFSKGPLAAFQTVQSPASGSASCRGFVVAVKSVGGVQSGLAHYFCTR